MRRTRRVWCQAAGLLLAATAVSPALAQGGNGKLVLPEDMPPRALPPGGKGAAPTRTDGEILPTPRVEPVPAPVVQPAPAPAVAPTAAGCGAGCEAKGGGWSWQRWRAEKHAWCQAHLWGYPAEWDAPPLGAAVHAHFRTMVANGEAASMVLYHCDFVDNTSALNLHGRDQLSRIAAIMANNGAPIVIERTPCAPGLAEARRTAVLNILAFNNIAVPPDRVVIGPSLAAGLPGVDASLLYGYSLRNLGTQAQPLPVPASGSGVGYSSGSGFGGGGMGGGGVR
jgi:hypothetical protein